MKKIILFIIISNYCVLYAQNTFDIPPGTLRLNDSLYIDKSPVTNFMFLEYLTSKSVLKKRGYSTLEDFLRDAPEEDLPAEMRILKIPSPLLIDFYFNKKRLKKKGYGKNSKFETLPVLNVSKKQALEYCTWRSKMVNFLWDKKYNKNTLRPQKVTYRLATKNELRSADIFFSNLNLKTQIPGTILNVNKEQVTAGFIIFPINEITVSGDPFNQKPTHEFIGFRCICELKD